MSNYVETLKLIKEAALAAVTASKPMSIYFGTVTGTSPIEINVEQRMTLGRKQLILTRNVKNYEVPISVNHTTEKHWDKEGVDHSHDIKGIKYATIHNGLSRGDEVILLQTQGGQKYIVLDRVS